MAESGCTGDQCRNLPELYKHAIEEYRFNVQLSWDRTRFYLGLNTALVAAIATLLRIESDSSWPLGVASMAGVATSAMGILTIRKGHRYYRHAVYKKTLIEDGLGLHTKVESHAHRLATLAIATTSTQAETHQILDETDGWLDRKIRFATTTGKLVWFMGFFLLLCSLGFLGWFGWP